MMEQREKLIELILICDKESDVLNCFNERPRLRQAAEIIADYLLANDVVVLPCKVGYTVYAAEKAPVIPLSVKDIAVFLEGEEGSDYERIENFGKIVFLNRKKAEAELKKMEERDRN